MTEQDTLPSCHETDNYGANIKIIPVELPDEYADHNYESVKEEIDELMTMGFYGDSEVDFARGRRCVDMNNPATIELVRRLPGLEKWLELIPTSLALEVIYDPEMDSYPGGYEISDQARDWFKNGEDPKGIRSRGEVVNMLMEQEWLRNLRLESVSLAGGTGRLVINKVSSILSTLPSSDIHHTVIDLHRDAIDSGRKLAEQLAVSDNVTFKGMNVLNPRGIHLTHENDDGDVTVKQFGFVDAIGFTEYLKSEDSEFEYRGVIDGDKETKPKPGAITFLKNAYDLVEPGGLLVVGNMLKSHPELKLTLNVVQWPHIQPRSIDEMLSLFTSSGFGDEAQIDIYCPSDGVYAIYAIRKPAESVS